MNLILIVCQFCLVTSSLQNLKLNIVLVNVFHDIKFAFPLQNFYFKDFFPLSSVSVPDIDSHKSLCLDNIKHIALTLGNLPLMLYKRIADFLKNSGDLLSYLRTKKIPWNCIKLYPDFICSEFNISDHNFHFEDDELFGQHIVSLSLPNLFNDHLRKNKPLLISFQGPTGSGKSLLSKIIVYSLFQDGFSSKFVHTYYGSRDFFLEIEKDHYRKKLLHEITFSSPCERNIFIFEEVDKMVPGVIDVILPFIYFSNNSSNIHTANSIFIFISNSGANKIEEIMYDAWLNGVPREEMILENFSSYLKTAAYNEYGGLQHSEIIRRNLIDVFLPFLPLEREHVKQCILKELNLRKMVFNKNTVEYIADQIIYHPPEFELYAKSGCKRVPQKVELYGDNDL